MTTIYFHHSSIRFSFLKKKKKMISPLPISYLQLNEKKRQNRSRPGTARLEKLVISPVESPRKDLPAPPHIIELLSGPQPKERCPKLLQPEPPASPRRVREVALSGIVNERSNEHKIARKRVAEWQRHAEDDSNTFTSTIRWVDMVAAVADESLNTIPGKLLRIEAATQILEKVGNLFDVRFGRSHRWAVNQLRDNILHSRETSLPRPKLTQEILDRLVAGDQKECDTYVEVCEALLLEIARLEEVASQREDTIMRFTSIIDCTLRTYQLKIKKFVFNSWKKNTSLSVKHSKECLKFIARAMRRATLRRIVLVWRNFIVVRNRDKKLAQSQAECQIITEKLQRITDQKILIENKLLEDIRVTTNELNEKRDQEAHYLSQLKEQDRTYHTKISLLQSQSAASKIRYEVTEGILESLQPGYQQRYQPSPGLMKLSHSLRKAYEKPSSMFLSLVRIRTVNCFFFKRVAHR